MSRPTVLQWQRSLGRCALAGLLGGLGLGAGLFGLILGIGGEWGGLALLAAGVVMVLLSEIAARRYRQVTTAGLRWQRTWRTDEYPWQQIGLSTKAPPEADSEAPDKILVHHRGGTVAWPEPNYHDFCLRQLGWWQRAQREFPYGDFRALPGFYSNLPKGPVHRRLHNPGRRAWQAVFAVVCTAAMLVFLMMAFGADEPSMTAAALVAAGLSGVGGWVSLRNATSRVWVHSDRIEQRRWFARRTVPFDQLAGSYVLKRPYVVGLGFLMAIGVVISLFSSGSDSLYDEVNNQQVPMLLLRDGTAVPLRALTSRSTTRVNKLAVALVDPGITQTPAPHPAAPQPQQPPPQQSQW